MNNIPFSHSVVVKDVPADGRTYRLEPDAEERRALAENLGIPEVSAMSAELRLRPAGGKAIAVRGWVDATVVQTCVVTLEPFSQELREDVDVMLMRAEDARPGARRRDELVDALETEGPEVFYNGRIDLGVIASEHLALGLDPYPHAPGVAFDPHLETDEAAASPFAALAAIKPPNS